jgi:hypothetical protein
VEAGTAPFDEVIARKAATFKYISSATKDADGEEKDWPAADAKMPFPWIITSVYQATRFAATSRQRKPAPKIGQPPPAFPWVTSDKGTNDVPYVLCNLEFFMIGHIIIKQQPNCYLEYVVCVYYCITLCHMLCPICVVWFLDVTGYNQSGSTQCQ